MKPLIETNPYLADPAKSDAMLRRSVLGSSHFEGIRGVKLRPAKSSRRKAAAKKSAKGK